MSSERRESLRTPVKLSIKVFHETMGELQLYTGNISDTGVYILAENQVVPPVGDLVTVQLQGLPAETPRLQARVVRSASDGMGLMFVDQA